MPRPDAAKPVAGNVNDAGDAVVGYVFAGDVGSVEHRHLTGHAEAGFPVVDMSVVRGFGSIEESPPAEIRAGLSPIVVDWVKWGVPPTDREVLQRETTETKMSTNE